MNEYAKRRKQDFWNNVKKTSKENDQKEQSIGEAIRDTSFILDSAILSFIFLFIGLGLLLTPIIILFLNLSTDSELTIAPMIIMLLIGILILLITYSKTKKLEDQDNFNKASYDHHASKKPFLLIKIFMDLFK
ncbi:hypothetical protein CWR48_03285 [Oceanobacillus arenosus]|uniref:Uncharacterized protein n=1 Tax=Oceanobacillus arenosus TaxID=1229153 RepID=A0A3D8Q1G2_9BACI|nr:hypothetical protein [Oceanobacillus arenosus]RDW21438.1 hypothetical protein CWR48_03285 [Oceanobacillus arenosus]